MAAWASLVLVSVIAPCPGLGAEATPLSSPSARLLDVHGAPSGAGLLQVRVGDLAAGAFGTVCGMNLAAADVVCRQLGFDYGSVSTSPCGNYGGADMCGRAGTLVAAMDLECRGGELDVGECSWARPNDSCGGHSSDSIVFCGNNFPHRPPSGAVRLLDSEGAPSINGEGRLEMFRAGSWTPVCREGFTPGSAAVACRAMGFAGAAAALPGRCASFRGENFCGKVAPRLSKLACAGQETSLGACPFEEEDDVFCAAEENVIVACVGEDGDSVGYLSS